MCGGKSCKDFEEQVNKRLTYLEYTVYRSLDFEEAASEGLQENNTGNWKRESLLCGGKIFSNPHRGARASHHRGLSCCGAQAPDVQAQ